MLFQHHINPEEKLHLSDPSWVLGSTTGPFIKQKNHSVFMRLGKEISLLGLDCRTERKLKQIVNPSTYNIIFDRFPDRGPRAKGSLAGTCQVGHAFSFLGVQERKRLAKERRRQRKPFGKGFLWTLSKNRGAAAPQTPEGFLFLVRFESKGCTIFGNALFLVCECARFWFVYNDFRAEQLIFGLFRRRANFLWKFLFAGASDVYGSFPHITANPPQGLLQSKSALRR